MEYYKRKLLKYYKRKLLKYLFNPRCCDLNSKLAALRWAKDYLASNSVIPSNIYTIYDDLGLLPEDNNRYDIFVERLVSEFGIKSNILEIGAGNIPRVAERIAEKQNECGIGTIKVYDSYMAVKESKFPNLIICREDFTLETDIRDYDILIGEYPCDATDLMIHRALTENKNLYIQMCGCVAPYEGMSDREYLYYCQHPDIYRQMLINSYLEYAKNFGGKFEVSETDTATPTLIYHRK